jgi:3-oxoacyl-[acyl-carrier-protein] synthase III
MPAEKETGLGQGSVPGSDQEPIQGQGQDRRPSRRPRIDITGRVFELEAVIAEKTITETLSTGSTLLLEEYTSPVSPITGVVAHFGGKKTRFWMDEKIRKILRRFPKRSKREEWSGPVGYSSGFGDVMRTPDSYSQEQRDSDTFEVALRLAERVLKQKGWKASEVDIVDFANSAADKGMSETLKKKLIEELQMREDVEVTGTFMACDGAGYALFERLRNPDSQGKKVLLLSVDQVTSEMPLDPKQVDTYAMQIFSNGAAGIAYQPGVDFALLTAKGANGETEPIGTTEEYEDVEGALKASPRYTDALDVIDAVEPEHKSIIYKIGNEIMMKLPKPPKGKKGWMNGSATARFFVTHSLENITTTYNKYKEYCRQNGIPDRTLDFAVGHHPSHQVFVVLQDKLIKAKHIDLPLEWVVPDGNSSGATSLIAFLRSMSQYKPGDHVMYISYGAGGSFTSFVIEIGGKRQEETSTSGQSEQIAA